PFELGKARALVEHPEPDLAILAYGVMSINALQALELLEGEYKISVYDARFARPVDIELITTLLGRDIPIITVEDHGILGGFGTCVLEACHEHGLETRGVTRLAIPDRWIYHGSRTDQLDECGLDPAGIARAVRQALDTSRERPLVTVPSKARETVRP
ncbi:MAG: transketolase C-terminal domain-containing protein, partial [Planctomycetota bacterium]